MRRDLIYSGQRFVVALLLALGLSSSGCSDSVSVSEDVRVPLASLVITPGTLQPGFFSNTTSYKVNAPTSADSVTVTATPRNSAVEVTINGLVTAAGQGRSISLGPPGSITTITIVLFSQTTGSETTYTINVTRLLSSDDNLSALTVTSGTLVPSFTSDTLDYTVNVATTVTSVTVSATKSDPNAAMLIGSVTVPPGANPGQAPITLGAPGTSTPVTIEVTAPNGNKKIYNLSVKRLSGDNNLSALSVAPHSLNPAFAANTVSYTVDVAYDVTSVAVSATKSDLNAVMQVHSVTVPAGTASGQDSITLNGPGTDTPVSIMVTAQNGVDSKTYTVTVHRAASDDNNLLALSLTAATVPLNLTPAFDQNHLDYTVEVPIGIFEVTVTATKSDPNAVLSGSVPDPGTGGAPGQATIQFILLPPPQVSITVTAPNGTFKTYTVTVNQAPAAPTP
jgi:hypothetical protein